MKSRMIVVILAAFAVALLASGCAAPGVSATALTVVASDGGYAPATLEAPSGIAIRITLDNQDGVPHQLAIEEIAIATQGGDAGAIAGMDHAMPGDATMPPVHIVANSGTQETVEFTPTQAGQYTFRCLEPGHTETGTLTVVRR